MSASVLATGRCRRRAFAIEQSESGVYSLIAETPTVSQDDCLVI